jgi:hypothetical protein
MHGLDFQKHTRGQARNFGGVWVRRGDHHAVPLSLGEGAVGTPSARVFLQK